MSVRTFFRIAGLITLCAVFWGIYLLMHQWSEQKIGAYLVRQNTLTGIVQINVGDGLWRTSFDNDPYATPIGPDEMKRVQFLDAAWGGNGILCARALVAPGPAVIGRLALRITIYDIARHQRIHEHELRETVNWPGGALTPFVLRTGLFAPDEKNQRTIITLQPTLYSGN